MTPDVIDSVSTQIGIITGIAYYFIYAVSSYFLRKKASQKIKNELQEDEYIVLEPKYHFAIDIIAPFCIGGFTGLFILTFLMYPEVQHIDGYMGGISREFLPILIIGTLILTIFFFYVACTKFVLTNKRMIYAWTFKYLYKFMNFFHKFKDLYYSDIKNFEYESYFMSKLLYLYTNDNERFYVSGFKNIDKFGSIIEKYHKNL